MRRLGQAVAGTVLTATLVAGCSGGPEAGAEQAGGPTLYVPTWLEPEQYQAIAGLPLADEHANVVLAFAVPEGEQLPTPEIPQGVVDVVGRLAADAHVSLAIGGYGTDETHQPILDGFEAQSYDPDAFAARIGQAADQVADRIGRPVDGIDMDWEYPEVAQAERFGALLGSLDRLYPDRRLSVAVPASDNTEGFMAAIGDLSRHADVVHVMTYDENTPYGDGGAGPVASRDWMLRSFEAWQQRLTEAGGSAKAAIGFPGYCYTYQGAQAEGDSFTAGTSLPYRSVDKSALQPLEDGSHGVADAEGWTSCFTPDDVRAVMAALPKGSIPVFAWSAEGLDEDYFAALSGR